MENVSAETRSATKPKPQENGPKKQKQGERDTIPKRCLVTSWRVESRREW